MVNVIKFLALFHRKIKFCFLLNQARVTGGCKICKRLWTLLRYHAQQCKNESCRIPLCKEIRVRIRQIQKQQQAMDDRRRQEMNRACRNEIR